MRPFSRLPAGGRHDVETGGFIAATDALLEIAAVMLSIDASGRLVRGATVRQHVRPFEGARMDPASLAVNGIDPWHPLRLASTESDALGVIFGEVRRQVREQQCTRQYTNTLPTYGNIPAKHFSAYVQDDWEITGNLTFNLGLRYDVQTGVFIEDVNGLLQKIEDKLGRDGSFPIPIPSSLTNDYKGRGDKNNWGPRVGFAWDPRADGVTNVHAAYGLFYDNVRTLLQGGELTWPQAKTINISRPSCPDPYNGQSRDQFLSTAPPAINVNDSNMVNAYAHQFNAGVSRMWPSLSIPAAHSSPAMLGSPAAGSRSTSRRSRFASTPAVSGSPLAPTPASMPSTCGVAV